MGAGYSRHSGAAVVQSGDYASMISELAIHRAAGNLDVIGELHTGGLVTPTSLIARRKWNADAAGYEMVGEDDLTRVTNSRWAHICGPITGADIHSDSNAAAPQGGTEIDGVGSWTEHGTGGAGTSGSEAGGAPGAGSYNLFATAGAGSVGFHLQISLTVENATEYVLGFWAKVEQPNEQKILVTGASGVVDVPIRNTEWQYFCHHITTSATTIIIEFFTDVSAASAGDKIMFDAVSVLKIDQTSTKVACNPSHNVVVGDAVTVWDASAGTTDETGKVVTAVDGKFISFGAALAQVPDDHGIDYFHAEGTCEFGELRSVANGGLWVPLSEATAYWSSGLMTLSEHDSQGSCTAFIPMIAAGATNAPQRVDVEVVADLTQSGVDNGTILGAGYIGQLDGTPYVFGSSINKSTGTWYQGLVIDDQPTPVAGASNAEADPDGETDILFNTAVALNGDGTLVIYGVTAQGGGLTGSIGVVDNNGALSTVNFTAGTGPVDGVLLMASNLGSGSCSFLAKKVRMHVRV